jgi:hypothetical protein
VVEVRIDALYVELPGKVLVTESASLAGLRLASFDGGDAVRAHLGRDRVEFRLARAIAPRAPEVDTFQSAELEFNLTGLEALGPNAWPLLAALRLRVSNSATGSPVPDSHIQRSLSLVDPDFNIGAEPTIDDFLVALPRVLLRSGRAEPASLVLDRGAKLLTLPAGDYRLAADFVPPAGYGLALAAGVSLQVEPGRSLLIRGPLQVRGTAERPVRVRGAKLAEPWGVLALQGRGRSSIGARRPRSEVRYLELSGGSQARLKGVVYTGQLSVHHQELSLQHAVLSRAFADDSLNVKYGEVDIRDSRFSDNQSDAVDCDWVEGRVTRSFFARSGSDGGDGLDLAGSTVTVSDSVFSALGDKCVSVGAASSVRLSGSLLRDCDTGLASKDDSLAEVTESLLLENRRSFAAYVKKPIFGGGSIRGRGLLLVGAAEPDSRDAASEIALEDAATIAHQGESGLDLGALRKTHDFTSARFRAIANQLR